ncbi:MAG: patatin-like phospholipase family protein [Flavobacteriales bacterium]|nr:patatin-like phospholipase family protein [Flavobacteriales bacterium]
MHRFLLLLSLILAIPGAQGQQVGLVLSGGGASGMAHIGVMKALEENGVPIDYIAGSSMGALIGAMYAVGYSPWQIDSLFRTDLYRDMAEGRIEPRYEYYFKQDHADASLLNLHFDLDTTLQTSLPTNLRSPALLDFEQMRGFSPASAATGYDMDSLFVPFRCVASDITAQRAKVFRRGDLAQAVRASMSYPFYFKPIRVDGHLMMDGGLYNNFPSDVMYADFFPDVIVGSNVSGSSPPPSEDDLLSQLRAMMQEPTNFTVICENGVIIEPRTSVPLFDFSDPGKAIADGYREAMKRMPEILAQVRDRVPRSVLDERRRAFRSRFPPMIFGHVEVEGLGRSSARYVEKTIAQAGNPLTPSRLKSAYFRLLADQNIAHVYPRATYVKERGNYDLLLNVKPEKDVEVRFGGMFSSRPINTGMVAMRYNLFGRASSHVEALSYFGKFYIAGQVKLRMDLPTKAPLYLEPVFSLHRWDHFRGFSTFFDEEKPAFVVIRETWGGLNAGMGMGNKGLLQFDAKLAETKDSYYQTSEFSGQDTTDVTYFRHLTSGLSLMRNSLNRKQHPNAGEKLSVSVRFVGGDEKTIGGSTNSTVEGPFFKDRHEWFVAKVQLDQYALPKGIFKFGVLLEGVYSTMPMFENYTASIIRAPAFQPTPESRTYFIDRFRAPKYVAGGLRTIIAVARNKFDLRLEAYLFQPYEPIVRGDDNEGITAAAFTERYYIGAGSLIYQSPVGPVWFNLSYFDGQNEPWAWSLNFGYILFNQKAQE